MTSAAAAVGDAAWLGLAADALLQGRSIVEPHLPSFDSLFQYITPLAMPLGRLMTNGEYAYT